MGQTLPQLIFRGQNQITRGQNRTITLPQKSLISGGKVFFSKNFFSGGGGAGGKTGFLGGNFPYAPDISSLEQLHVYSYVVI